MIPRLALLLAALAHGQPFVNSLGMKMLPIPAGSFVRGETARVTDALLTPLTYPRRDEMERLYPGQGPFVLPFEARRNGDYDERPAHRVRISRPFFAAATEVTNAQYEQFDPAHRALRGKAGFSKGDDEAVVFVSWHEARAFCEWLSKKEGRAYRLPTEAEWEYFARAGTRTLFSTGDTLPPAFLKNARNTEFDAPDDIVPLRVAQTPPNPWGLHDVHGNVEEWTADWYGPYAPGDQSDPTGRAAGEFRVTRGGSHGTDPYYLRSANRAANLPATRNFLTGFRVVAADPPAAQPLPAVRSEDRPGGGPGEVIDMSRPYFRGPRQYVKIPANAHGPLYAWHNHDTAIAECPNGDLLAIWYTCEQERGRELAVASARLPRGASEWQPARLFWDVPDRNDHTPALWFDGADTLYHFNGLGPAGRWEPLAIVMRKSTDSGRTWSPAELIAPEYGYRNMVGQPVLRTRDGAIVFGADAAGGSTIWVSRDNGKTWADPGGTMRGIHVGMVERKDGSLFAIGRGQNLGGYSPANVSRDLGRTWQASPSGLPPLGGGQRLVMIRLNDGALFLASFAEDVAGFSIPGRRPHTNLFGALSFDEGRTWPVRRLIPADARDGIGTIDGGWIGKPEAQGYLSVTQSRDGLIHLLSSWNHYAFNVAWLKAAAPLTPPPPVAKDLPRRALRANADANAALDPRRGATFEFAPGEFFLSVRTGALTANQYRVRVERGRVARLALRADTTAQLYIDGQFDRVLPAELVIDWREPARGTFWNHTGGPVTADTTGAWAPR